MEEERRRLSQSDFVLSYFVEHPNEDLTTASVVDWATDEWFRVNSSRFKDPDRAIRRLAELGLIQQLSKGLYRYVPDHIVPVEDRPKSKRQTSDSAVKNRVCAACGRGSATDAAVEAVRISEETPATMLLCRIHADLYRRVGALDLCANLFAALAVEANGRGDDDLASFCNRMIADIHTFTRINLN